MFLTRMPLNAARRDARRLLGSPQSLHAAVLASFPPSLPAQERVLWRVDRDAAHSALLYLLSPGRPDLTHLVEQAGWPTTSSWETREYGPLLDRLAPGQQWAFRLTANPVRRVRPAEGGRGVIKAHVTAAQQLSWLVDRAPANGFRLGRDTGGDPTVAIRDRRSLRFPRQGQTVSLVTASFEGLLIIVDADLLRATLVSGLGRAKGYGCGLLTLAPPGQVDEVAERTFNADGAADPVDGSGAGPSRSVPHTPPAGPGPGAGLAQEKRLPIMIIFC